MAVENRRVGEVGFGSYFYVGYKTKVNEEYATLIPRPKAPKNYRDEEKIIAYEAEAFEAACAEARDKPLTGAFDTVSILKWDPDNKCVAEVGLPHGAVASDTVLSQLPSKDAIIFVMHASTFLKLAIHEQYDSGAMLNPQMHWAVRSEVTYYPFLCDYLNPTKVVDPLRVLLGAAAYPFLCDYSNPTKVVDPLRVLLGAAADTLPLATVAKRYHEHELANKFETSQYTSLDLAIFTRRLAQVIGCG